jgi:alkanesulfonate monooxygenase SsuD/methylene tetrahydromethanopterin reductase-like flavin-dependent oxidoreductase (luciferase family)
MRFGLFLCSQHHPGDPLDQRLAELLEQAALAEELGYDVLAVGDHHVTEDAYFNTFVVLGALAARTRRVELATAILLLPLYHPIYVAEAAAMADIASGGRMVLGVAAGYRREEFAALGVPYEERLPRLREGIGLLRRLWGEARVRHDGPSWRFPEVTLNLRPLRGRCPIWVGANSPAAARVAGELGDAWVTDPTAPLARLRELAQVYRAARREAGHAGDGEIVLFREAYVAPTAREADAAVRPHLEEKYRKYLEWGFAPVREAGVSYEALRTQERFIVGDPDACVGSLGRYREALGPELTLLRIQFVGMPQAKVLPAMRLFAQAVMPALRG